MRHTVLIALLALALSGCATARQPGIEIREVPVPVAVPCIAASDIPPDPEFVHNKLTGEARHDASILGESALQLRRWGEKMHGLLWACAAPSTAPP